MLLETLKNNRLLFGVLGGILLVIIIGTLIVAFTVQPPKSISKTGELNSIPPISDTELADIGATEEFPLPEQTADFAHLVDKSLLEQQIPNDSALIKDELVQLQDIDAQLNEQKAILDQQHQDMDSLIKLKEEQLTQLEQQVIAQ